MTAFTLRRSLLYVPGNMPSMLQNIPIFAADAVIIDLEDAVPLARTLVEAGLRASGVPFPGHFLVKCRMGMGEIVIDPFTGAPMSSTRLEELLAVYRQGSDLPADLELPLEFFLRGASKRQILARMLRNLKEVHRAARFGFGCSAGGGAACAKLVKLAPAHSSAAPDSRRWTVFTEPPQACCGSRKRKTARSLQAGAPFCDVQPRHRGG